MNARLSKLDSIPWQTLSHAYGSADDVPRLLRALQTAVPDVKDEDSPVRQLFGNIWHQGTVYEATSYAVPFLIELAADTRTPERVRVLDLLAAIARGTSFLDVHEPFLRARDRDALRSASWLKRWVRSLSAPRRERSFQSEKARELEWVAKARQAVDTGFDEFVEMTNEGSEVRYAAAHVLAQLPARAASIGPLLRQLLEKESRTLYRAGLILLLGDVGKKSEETISLLLKVARDGDVVQRRAAAITIGRLKPAPLPARARQIVVEAIEDEDRVDIFLGLPWSVEPTIDHRDLFDCLNKADHEAIACTLIERLETRTAGDATVDTLLDLLFPMAGFGGTTPIRTAANVSPLQLRAIRAMADAWKHDQRLFGHISLFQWGLPDTRRGLRKLAAHRR